MSGDKLTLSVTVLLTGFAVVFAVLFLLIGIIKAYGTIIYNIQNKGQKKKKKTPPVKVTSQPKVMEPIATVEAEEVTDDDELIAVISAAVYSMYSSSQVRIKSIRKSPAKSNAWRNAGLSDNLRPF